MNDMTNTQQDALIKLISMQSNTKVFPFPMGGGIKIVVERKNGCTQYSVWLDRKNSVERLKEVLNKLSVFIPAL